MLERLHNGEFVGMDFKEVLEELRERGIEPAEVEYPTNEDLGGITVGSLYLDYYIIEFDTDAVCDNCYHGKCEE